MKAEVCRAGWDDLSQSGKSPPALSTHTPLSQKCLGKKKKRVKSLVFQWIECFCWSDFRKNKQNFLTVESFWWLSCECLSIAYYLGWNQVLKSFNMWSHDKIYLLTEFSWLLHSDHASWPWAKYFPSSPPTQSISMYNSPPNYRVRSFWVWMLQMPPVTILF